ncbi:glutathione S-transferase N-terminal domain-containing protein [Sulfitobacter sp. LCG007]
MADTLALHPVFTRWTLRHPERLQLFTAPTPNGVKVSILLEELGRPYEAHRVDIGRGDTATPEFRALNPNGKLPAILDPDGPGKRPFALWESGAILLYLAEAEGRLIGWDAAGRMAALQWLMFQMSAVGPIFGQVGWFHRFDGRRIEDPRPKERYVAEARRLLSVLDDRLTRSEWIAGDSYTIADIATIGWVWTLTEYYDAADLVTLPSFAAVDRWRRACLARPAVQRGLTVGAAT